MAINNIEDLRNVLLESIEELTSNIDEVTRMGVIAKSAEGVMSSLKLQLQYAGMRGEEPQIDFLDSSAPKAKTLTKK